MSRLPQTSSSLLRYLRERERSALRQAQTSPFTLPLTPGTIGSEFWLEPALLNGWVNYGLGYAVAGYAAMADGSVKLRGFVASGSTAAPIFTLLPTYAPASIEVFTGQAGGNGTARIEVAASGAVSVAAYNGTGTNAFLSLSGIRFSPVGF